MLRNAPFSPSNHLRITPTRKNRFIARRRGSSHPELQPQGLRTMPPRRVSSEISGKGHTDRKCSKDETNIKESVRDNNDDHVSSQAQCRTIATEIHNHESASKATKASPKSVIDALASNEKPKVTVKLTAVQEFLMGHHHHALDDDDSISLQAALDRSTLPDVQRLCSILRRFRIRGGRDQVDHHKSYHQEPLASAFVVYNERKITDPMQRAGLRLLSSAVVLIQAVNRRHLALRQALTRMLAIVILQSTSAGNWSEVT
jgi:hypothetical protein